MLFRSGFCFLDFNIILTYKKTKVSKQGEIYEETVNEVLVSADMTWTWVNNNKPEERINVDCCHAHVCSYDGIRRTEHTRN